ncbi:beta family protein [Streptomyces endophytica]|uniref:beta family protein n=1 Tax=Streptomyces endophytica TaxID=2991496 RepID=UPI003C6FC0CC
MSEPFYVPVLPVRQYARTAYAHLRPDVQAATAPLWNLPPSPGVTLEALRNAPGRRN